MNNFIPKLNQKIVAIVPAAGSGARMNINIPKQYIRLGELTILEYTIHKLLTFSLIEKIIVVISPNDTIFRALPIASHEKIQIAYGGENRSDSVLAGLMLLDDEDWALVHDAARPCITHDDIFTLINTVIAHNQGGILATRVTDTIKKSFSNESNQIEQTCDRQLLWAAATPQMFNVKKLRESISIAIDKQLMITDEASALELQGEHPLLVECRRDNIKVTRTEDLSLAKFYLKEQDCLQE